MEDRRVRGQGLALEHIYLPTFAGFAIRLQSEPHRTAAAYPGGGVLTGPVTAAIVYSTAL